MVSLKVQKRLAASLLNCGKRKVWLDPSEALHISIANSRVLTPAWHMQLAGMDVRKLVKDNVIMKKQNVTQSRWRWRCKQASGIAKRKGYGKRKGTREARLASKVLWMRKTRVLRRLLRKYREMNKIDKHMYREMYMKAKGGIFKNKRALVETLHRAKRDQKATDRKAHFDQIIAFKAMGRKGSKETWVPRRKQNLSPPMEVIDVFE